MNTSWAIQIRVDIYVWYPGCVVNVPSLLAHFNYNILKIKLAVALRVGYLSGHFVMAPLWLLEICFNNAHFDKSRQNDNVPRRVTGSWRDAISGSVVVVVINLREILNAYIEDVVTHIPITNYWFVWSIYTGTYLVNPTFRRLDLWNSEVISAAHRSTMAVMFGKNQFAVLVWLAELKAHTEDMVIPSLIIDLYGNYSTGFHGSQWVNKIYKYANICYLTYHINSATPMCGAV